MGQGASDIDVIEHDPPLPDGEVAILCERLKIEDVWHKHQIQNTGASRTKVEALINRKDWVSAFITLLHQVAEETFEYEIIEFVAEVSPFVHEEGREASVSYQKWIYKKYILGWIQKGTKSLQINIGYDTQLKFDKWTKEDDLDENGNPKL
eukprot:150425_1